MRRPCVYILASQRNGTLYIGVTSDLIKRVWEHKNDVVEGFTKRYGAHLLVWYELHETMEAAITREKAMKEWKRVWKLELIEEANPEWKVCMTTFGHRKTGRTPAWAEETNNSRVGRTVIPADAGIQRFTGFHVSNWTPAFAGETAHYLSHLRSKPCSVVGIAFARSKATCYFSRSPGIVLMNVLRKTSEARILSDSETASR